VQYYYPKNFIIFYLLRKRETGTIGVLTVHEGLNTVTDDKIVDVIFEKALIRIELFHSIL
jgi:hypothetical protein